MNNKISYHLFQAFAARGFSTLRFNFRGVGRSQGEFDQGEGELSDAASALDWMQTHNPNASTCWIGGFSFGAWLAMRSFRHKTKHRRFQILVPFALFAQVTLVVWLAWR